MAIFNSYVKLPEGRGVDRYPIDRYPALRITCAQEVAGGFSARETGGALTRWMVKMSSVDATIGEKKDS